MGFISVSGMRRIKIFTKRVLESLNLKLTVYKILISASQLIALKRIRKIARNSNPIEIKKSGKKIVFNSVDGRYMPHTYIEGGIAKALQIRGHDVKMIICGEALDMCTTHFTLRKPPNSWSCKNCVSFSKKFYETSDLPYATYKDYIDEKEIEKIRKKVKEMNLEECKNLEYKGARVGFHAVTSALRYFKGARPPKEQYEKILRSELVNAIITTNVAEKVVEKEKPDILFTSHACYSSWGSFADYFINHDIILHVWYTGYKKNTLIFDLNLIDDSFEQYYNKIRQKKPLSKEEEKELYNFINKRIKGEEGDTTIYGFTKKEIDLEKQFNFGKYKKNYAMFPNVAWDASMIRDTHKGFKDVFDWLAYTIELFKDKPRQQLLIKVHPAERINESELTVYDYLLNNYKSPPENIKIIPPTTTITAYSLFPYIDAGLMYTGTLCIEMALNDVPVIMVGKSRYNEKGFTIDITTKQEYKDILNNGVPPLSDKGKEMAKIYGYFYFIKSFVPRRFIYYKNFLNLGWNINSFDDLVPGKDKYLDHLCNYILYGGIYQDW